MPRRHAFEETDWSELVVEASVVGEHLVHAAFGQGEVWGALRSLTDADCRSLERAALVESVLATSNLSQQPVTEADVGASLSSAPIPSGSGADGIVALLIDAHHHARSLLTFSRLRRWHRELFPFAPPALSPSGPSTRGQALPAGRIADELGALLGWIAAPPKDPPLVQAALAHLRFATIRPFGEGDGRIGRAVTDLVIARALPNVAPYISFAQRLCVERDAYVAQLEAARRGDISLTAWIVWFIACYDRATMQAVRSIDEMLRAGKFWRDHADVEMNARQRRVLERYFAENARSINSREYSEIAKTSPDSAQRDLADLAKKHIIVPNAGKARNTSYRLRDDIQLERSPRAIEAPPRTARVGGRATAASVSGE